jgi:glutamyl/glutaminyl-tRNA synthetase
MFQHGAACGTAAGFIRALALGRIWRWWYPRQTISTTSLCILGLVVRETTQSTTKGINWRFRVPDGEGIRFDDLHLGPQEFIAGRDFGDFVVWRRDDVPAYQLAVVVDDAEMQITEVVRGADLLKSTARQILLCRALAYTTPAYYHCDLVRDEKGQRMAKRDDSASIRYLRESGRTKEEVLRQVELLTRFIPHR